ncbi:MAG: hypothetical protein LC624_01080 [Halobacteriales archaeon]|nr:hypothetical protein [Halobacteriales archaeon]
MAPARPRYLALRAEPPLPPPQLEQRCLAALREALGLREMERVRARLYHLGPGLAIARVDHVTQPAARAALAALAPHVRTVATSGTLRQAKRALGVRSGPRRRRARPRDPPAPKRVNKGPGNR